MHHLTLEILKRPISHWVQEVIQPVKNTVFVIHMFGKLRRFYLVHFRKRYIQQQQTMRRGACRQCGQCCTFVHTCPLLTKDGLCMVYNTCRVKACKLFPIDERDIRDVVVAGGRCGYYFVNNR